MNKKAKAIHGSCLCGEVQFSVTKPLLAMGNCHCSMCRHQHGTAFSTYAQADSDALNLIGGQALIQTYLSSAQASRDFCSHCGSKLFYRLKQAPQFVWIAAGAFDDDPGLLPSYHIFTATKAPWHDITDELPQYTSFPPQH